MSDALRRLGFFSTQSSIRRFQAATRTLADVTQRYSGRTEKEAKEVWVLARALRHSGRLAGHPFVLSKSESPDFLLSSGEGVFGVEVAEIIYPQTAKGNDFSRKMGFGTYRPVSPDDLNCSALREDFKKVLLGEIGEAYL